MSSDVAFCKNIHIDLLPIPMESRSRVMHDEYSCTNYMDLFESHVWRAQDRNLWYSVLVAMASQSKTPVQYYEESVCTPKRAMSSSDTQSSDHDSIPSRSRFFNRPLGLGAILCLGGRRRPCGKIESDYGTFAYGNTPDCGTTKSLRKIGGGITRWNRNDWRKNRPTYRRSLF